MINSEEARKVKQVEVRCSMCSGVGGNGWEDICTACDGEGRVTATVYADCGHQVDNDECFEEGCETFPLEHPELKALWEAESEREEEEQCATS